MTNKTTISKRKILIPIAAFVVILALVLGVFAFLHIGVETTNNSADSALVAAEAKITDANSLRTVVESAGYEKPTIKDKYLVTDISDDATTVDVSTQTSPLNITRAGTFILTGTNTDLQVKVNAPDTADVRIVLDNANITSKTGAVIDSELADHTIIISKAGTTNTLTDASGWVVEDDDSSSVKNPNGVIYSLHGLVVIGEGTLNINANGKFGVATHGDLNLNANLNIVSTGSAIHGSDSVYVLGGNYKISSGNDGMHAKDNLVITAGTINITKSLEGLEGTTISVTGGDINIVASDDGVNASDQQTESTTSTDGAADMPAARDGNAAAPNGAGTPPTDMPTDGSFTPGAQGGGGPRGGHGGPGSTSTDGVPTEGGPGFDGGTPPQDGGPDAADAGGAAAQGGRGNWGGDTSGQASGATPGTTSGTAPGGMGGGGSKGGGEQALNNVWLYVSGGTITVTINGRGDGIDSNGHILQTGGIIKSNDAASGGDGPFDYNGIYGFFPENGAEMWANGKQLTTPTNTM
jgi:hypothetical protein